MASPFGLAFPDLSEKPSMWPLVSTTASVSIAIWEAITFNGLIKASRIDRPAAARTISLWWKMTLNDALPVIFFLGLNSLFGGLYALRRLRAKERYVAIAGTVLSAGHFLYAPAIAKTIDGMATAYDGLQEIDAKEEQLGEVVDERVVKQQQQWLKIHTWRTLTSDIPAMLCFAWLVMKGKK